MFRKPAALALLFLIPASFACAGGDARSPRRAEWTASVDTIGDTIRVHTVSGQVWPSDGRLVSRVDIGVLDGAPEYQFGDVKALTVDPDGRIFVLDGHGPVIRMYAPDGKYMRDVGREGEGPGEYKRPDSGLVMLAGGTLALRDPGNGRISRYAPDGTFVGSWPLAGSMNTSNPMVATRDGIVVTPVIKNLGKSVLEWQRGMARYRPDGTVDTVDVPVLEFDEARISGESEGNSSTSSVPFTPQQEYAYSPLGYFVTGITNAYSFLLLRPGASVLKVSMDYEPVPVLEEEAAIQRDRITKNFREQFPGWHWNGPPIPTTKPAYSDLLASDEGRIWVRRHVASERYLSADEQRAEEERQERPVNPFREPAVFDVFEPTGKYLGRVTAPEGFQVNPVPTLRGDTVWAVVTDDLDVAHIHRFEIDFGPMETTLATRD